MKLTVLVAVALAAALLALPAAAPAAPTRTALAKSVKKLKRERTKLRRAVRREKASVKKYKGLAGDRLTRLNSAYGQLGTLNGRVAFLNRQVSDLKGPVPNQVAAIAREDNIEQLFNLVIRPAYNNWPCRGSTFYSPYFYSVDFNRRQGDGSC